MVVKHCDVTNDAVLGKKVRSGRRRVSVGLTASRRGSLGGVPLLTSFAATPVISTRIWSLSTVTSPMTLGKKVRSGRRRVSVGLTASRRGSLGGVPLLTSFAATPVIRVWLDNGHESS
nr:uncharacterized protein LOC123745682 [Procambarus clarkii]